MHYIHIGRKLLAIYIFPYSYHNNTKFHQYKTHVKLKHVKSYIRKIKIVIDKY